MRYRADFKAGETVLVNGATGSAGRLAVQIAKYLGAKKVVGTGRDAMVLESLKNLGADVTINLTLDHNELSKALEVQFDEGIDVILDYVFGESAGLLLAAAARSMKDSKQLRYVEVGGVSGQGLEIPPGLLRQKPIVLMGSGVGSVPLTRLVEATAEVMRIALPNRLWIPTRVVPLRNVEETWNANLGKDRVVFVLGPV